jgi:hypothetical protein
VLFEEAMWPSWTVASYLLSKVALDSSVSLQKTALLGLGAYLARRAGSGICNCFTKNYADPDVDKKIVAYIVGLAVSAGILAAYNFAGSKDLETNDWALFFQAAEGIALGGCALYKLLMWGFSPLEVSRYEIASMAVAAAHQQTPMQNLQESSAPLPSLQEGLKKGNNSPPSLEESIAREADETIFEV